MQKLAAISKFTDIDITTVFLSHMSDWFLKLVMIKRNLLILKYIKTHTRYYLWKQTSINIVRNILYSSSKRSNVGGRVSLTEIGVVGE